MLAVGGARTPLTITMRSTKWTWDDPSLPAWAATHSGAANAASASLACEPVLHVAASVPPAVFLALAVVDDWVGTLARRGLGVAPGARAAAALLFCAVMAGSGGGAEFVMLAAAASCGSAVAAAAAWAVPIAALGDGVLEGGGRMPLLVACSAAAWTMAERSRPASAMRAAAAEIAIAACMCSGPFRALRRHENAMC